MQIMDRSDCGTGIFRSLAGAEMGYGFGENRFAGQWRIGVQGLSIDFIFAFCITG